MSRASSRRALRLARRAVSIVIAPWRAPGQGRVGGDVGDSGSPYAQEKTLSSNGMPRCRAETWIQARAAPGPERASPLYLGSPGLDSGPLGWPLFRYRTALSAARHLIWRKRGTRKSRLETNTENEACSALLARLWCHLPLQNPANRAENPIRLCSATIGRTGWRMVQVGAIRSRQKVVQLLAEILNQKSQWRFRRFRVFRVFPTVHGVRRVSR